MDSRTTAVVLSALSAAAVLTSCSNDDGKPARSTCDHVPASIVADAFGVPAADLDINGTDYRTHPALIDQETGASAANECTWRNSMDGGRYVRLSSRIDSKTAKEIRLENKPGQHNCPDYVAIGPGGGTGGSCAHKVGSGSRTSLAATYPGSLVTLVEIYRSDGQGAQGDRETAEAIAAAYYDATRTA